MSICLGSFSTLLLPLMIIATSHAFRSPLRVHRGTRMTTAKMSDLSSNNALDSDPIDRHNKHEKNLQEQHAQTKYELTPVQSTSLLTAYWRHLETSNSNNPPLIQDPTAQVLLDVLLSPSQRQDYDQSPIRPYGIECMAVRTRAMDDWLTTTQINTEKTADITGATTTSNKNTRRQLVNLGAGMCCRPYRIEDIHHHVHAWWEVDSDLQLLTIKRSVLEASGYEPRLPVVDVSVDLACPATNLRECLQKHGFCLETPTDWIAEGLFAYLKPHQHTKVLQETAAASVSGSRMAVTVAEPAMNDFWESLGVRLPYDDLVPIDQILTKAMEFGWSVDQHIQPQDWCRLYPGRGEQLPGYHVLFLVKD